MAQDGFLDEDVAVLSDRIRRGALGVGRVVRACLARIAARDPELHAFVAVFADASERRARELDAEIARGIWRGPLHGMPVAVKDVADMEGEITGFGSRSYSAVPAARDAVVVAALRAAGAVLVGKTQTVEFAFGSWGTNHGLGTPVNPAVPGHASPGGSSSGSAVAVAAGLVPLALGSDTGGSVRIPAALCGVAGMKPSHGLIPLDGIAQLSPSLDTIGPLARSVAGLRILLDAMQPDPGGPPAPAVPVRIWTLEDADLAPVDAAVLAAYRARIAALRASGVATGTLPLPRPLAEYQALCGALMALDAYAALAPLVDDHRLPMDPWVRRRIAQGGAISPERHRAITAGRRHDIAAFRDRFGPDDLLVLPTTPCPPRPIAEIDETEIPMSRYTRFANYLDLCAVTVPLSRDGGPPVGLQAVARTGRDALLLAAVSPGGPLGDPG